MESVRHRLSDASKACSWSSWGWPSAGRALAPVPDQHQQQEEDAVVHELHEMSGARSAGVDVAARNGRRREDRLDKRLALDMGTDGAAVRRALRGFYDD